MMVRLRLLLGTLALGLCPLVGQPAGGSAGWAEPASSPDDGWLELRRDQRVYREQVGPLSPAEDADLRLLERRQGLDRQVLEQRQRQQRQRLPRDPSTGAAAGLGLRQQQRREAGEQRLDWRIERELLGR